MKNFFIFTGLSFFCFFICSVFFLKSNFSSKINSDFFKNSQNFSFSKTFTFNEKDTVVKNYEESFDLNNIDKIRIDAEMGAFKIKSKEGLNDKVIFKIKTFSKKGTETFDVQGKTLNLKIKKLGKETYINKSTEVVVYLPKNSKNLDLETFVSFGEVKLRDLIFNNLTVDIAAGSFKGKSLTLNEAKIEVSAGEVKLSDTFFNSIKSSVDGGSAVIKGLNPAPKAIVKTSAGKIDFEVDKSVVKNFRLQAKTSFGSTKLVEGYTESTDGSYVYGDGKGEVVLKADLGEINVF